MKKKPDKKLVLAMLVVLAGMASASFSKGLDHRGTLQDALKKSHTTGAFRA